MNEVNGMQKNSCETRNQLELQITWVAMLSYAEGFKANGEQ